MSLMSFIYIVLQRQFPLLPAVIQVHILKINQNIQTHDTYKRLYIYLIYVWMYILDNDELKM